ncbi:MAG: methylase of chemotaxis methyl-accepting protein [Paucimonas sp.]|nr:methylase of chemotaxis methyl-accepting protein [Paucimonas sp.]
MAFLVVQHLDPHRASLLASILAARTALAVSEAIEGVAVEVNHIYVIPPNTSMSIEGGRLKLAARSKALGPPSPIDDLFESLAEDQGSNGIGVVLSGSGSDGAIGLQSLHNVGAITFAQDESAKYSSMPRIVRELGCVDLVLPPEGIAEELLRIASHPYLTSGSPALGKQDSQIDEDRLQQLFLVLKRGCSIDFSNYKRGTIYRRVARRQALRNIGSVTEYIIVLQTEPEEVRALCRDLLIRFTQFFRDPETFAILAADVFSRFAQAGGADDPIRIWVAGCASGEEVYSLAICLMEYLGAHSIHRSIQIFGTDVSEDALELARAGRYIENIARNVTPDRLQQFFVRENDYYRVSRAVRDCCTFAQQNVAHDPPFSRMDLITCRNLLIYLDPSLQRRVIPLLHYALKPQGVLMLGLSESIGGASELFAPIGNQRHKLFAKKVLPGRAHTLPTLDFKPINPRSTRAPGGGQPSADDRFRRQVDRVALDEYAPPAVLCDEEMNIVEFRGDTSAYLFNRPGVPTTQLRHLARPGLEVAIADCIQQAPRENRVVRKGNLRVESTAAMLEVSVRVVPVSPLQGEGPWFLVFFEGSQMPASSRPAVRPGLWASLKAFVSGAHSQKALTTLKLGVPSEIDRLTDELRATRAHMAMIVDEHETAIQDLKSSEEEMLSSNEEYQSTNEELETAKEELQSLNEELSTTNDELGYRNRELKEMNDQLVEARDYANAIVETTAEPMLVLQNDFRVVRANHAFYEGFQTTPAETLQVNLHALGNGQWDQPALRRLLQDLSPQHSRVKDYEISAVFPRIGQRTIVLNAVHLAWTDYPMILLTMRDVTERHNAMDVLRTTDRQKDEFLAMLGHELRNPLAAMRNALELWQVSGNDKKTQREVIAVFERQVNNQVRLVDDLLDVSRITHGVIGLQIQQFDLAKIVRQAYESALPQIKAQQLVAKLTLPPEPVFVSGDPMRLEQVVGNVLGNAVKYTPPGGQIDVKLDRDKKEAVLTMTDTGIGMNAEFLPEIFDLFVQARRSVDKNTAGMGIGLALVRRLVNMHGGTVKAESAGLQKGSTFVIRLPALAQDSILHEAATILEEAAMVQHCRILVVDDNVDVLKISEEVLHIYGHEVRTAADGKTALEIARDFLADLVLLDIGLPGIDGYEVCRRMKMLPGWQNTVIVANSGYGQGTERQKSEDAGFDHHLVKPINLAKISGLAKRFRGDEIAGIQPEAGKP